ncbi:hypothetical protein GO491_11800 [Flavobacteriaceae bacterium Ap0902]|nr:hypothetical protein [Flavobacteriaceae bacterium Ap0902]
MKRILILSILFLSINGFSQITINESPTEEISVVKNMGFKIGLIERQGDLYRIRLAETVGMGMPSLNDSFEFSFKASEEEFNQFANAVENAIKSKEDLSVNLGDSEFRLNYTSFSIVIEKYKGDELINTSAPFNKRKFLKFFNAK